MKLTEAQPATLPSSPLTAPAAAEGSSRPCNGAAHSAKLSIHTAPDSAVPTSVGRRAVPWLHHVRTLLHPAPAPVALTVHDLEGRCLLALDNAGALLELALPAGIYHVTLQSSAAQRRYTVALAAGTTVDLNLQSAR